MVVPLRPLRCSATLNQLTMGDVHPPGLPDQACHAPFELSDWLIEIA